MDVVTLALAKKFALKVAAGFSSVSVDEGTSTINFVLNDGTNVSLKIPRPKEVKDIQMVPTVVEGKTEEHLVFIMSDKSSIDVGTLPEQQINLSKKDGNALKKMEDGYYVAKTGVELSPKPDNTLKNLEDGLYVPSPKEQEEEILNIIKDNTENENIDFSDWN